MVDVVEIGLVVEVEAPVADRSCGRTMSETAEVWTVLLHPLKVSTAKTAAINVTDLFILF